MTRTEEALDFARRMAEAFLKDQSSTAYFFAQKAFDNGDALEYDAVKERLERIAEAGLKGKISKAPKILPFRRRCGNCGHIRYRNVAPYKEGECRCYCHAEGRREYEQHQRRLKREQKKGRRHA